MSYMRPAKIGAKQNLKLVAGKNSNRQAQSNQNSIIWLWTYLKEDHEHTWCIQRKVLTFDGHAITLLNIKLTCDKIKTPWCDCSGVEPDKPKKMKRIKDSIMPILHPRNWPLRDLLTGGNKSLFYAENWNAKGVVINRYFPLQISKTTFQPLGKIGLDKIRG